MSDLNILAELIQAEISVGRRVLCIFPSRRAEMDAKRLLDLFRNERLVGSAVASDVSRLCGYRVHTALCFGWWDYSSEAMCRVNLMTQGFADPKILKFGTDWSF